MISEHLLVLSSLLDATTNDGSRGRECPLGAPPGKILEGTIQKPQQRRPRTGLEPKALNIAQGAAASRSFPPPGISKDRHPTLLGEAVASRRLRWPYNSPTTNHHPQAAAVARKAETMRQPHDGPRAVNEGGSFEFEHPSPLIICSSRRVHAAAPRAEARDKSSATKTRKPSMGRKAKSLGVPSALLNASKTTA